MKAKATGLVSTAVATVIRAHLAKSFVLVTFCEKNPRGDDFALDIDLFRGVGVVFGDKRIAERIHFLYGIPCGIDRAATSESQGSREVQVAFGPGVTAPGKRIRWQSESGSVSPAVTLGGQARRLRFGRRRGRRGRSAGRAASS